MESKELERLRKRVRQRSGELVEMKKKPAALMKKLERGREKKGNDEQIIVRRD